MKNFLSKYEQYCLTLAQKVYEDENCAMSVIYKDFRVGCFYHSKGGQILHFLPSPLKAKEFINNYFLSDAAKEKEIFSIIGEKKGTELIRNLIENALNRKCDFIAEYDLLEWKTREISLKKDTDYIFVKATQEDFEQIFPLQVMYEKVEVFYKDGQQDLKITALNLQNNIRAGKVYVLKNIQTGKIISKLNVSAEGKRYLQAGGVFTDLNFRNKGFAKRIISEFQNLAKEQGKNAVLFVKKENVPAQKVYEDSGFRKISDFEIVYY